MASSASPVRLQLSRRKGFDLQAFSCAANGLPAVVVSSPSKWGNPFIVGRDGTAAECVAAFRHSLEARLGPPLTGALPRHDLVEIRGRNLACWCKPGAPCHADMLLELPNP